MFYYQIYRKNVASDYRFRVLCEEKTDANIDVVVRENKDLEFISDLDDCKDSEKYAWKSQRLDGVLYYMKDYGTFKISNGNLIEYHLYDEIPRRDFVEIFVLNTCFPHILVQCNQFAMHGSAIKIGNSSIIISGASGSGKSTLSEVLIKKYSQFLSDDVVLIEDIENQIYALPSFLYIKLSADAAEHFGYDKEKTIPIEENDRNKVVVVAEDDYCSTEMPLGAIVVIKPDDIEEVSIRRIIGAESLKYIIDNLYQIASYGDRNIPAPVTAKIMKMAQTVPVYELSRPNGKMTVNEQMKLLENTLEVCER